MRSRDVLIHRQVPASYPPNLERGMGLRMLREHLDEEVDLRALEYFQATRVEPDLLPFEVVGNRLAVDGLDFLDRNLVRLAFAAKARAQADAIDAHAGRERLWAPAARSGLKRISRTERGAGALHKTSLFSDAAGARKLQRELDQQVCVQATVNPNLTGLYFAVGVAIGEIGLREETGVFCLQPAPLRKDLLRLIIAETSY